MAIRYFKALFLSLALMTTSDGAAEDVTVKTAIESADCTMLEAAFHLRVFDHRFPMSSGFEFTGLHRGDAVFMKESKEDPSDDPTKYADSEALVAALRRRSEAFASVRVSSKREDDKVSADDFGYRRMDWKGLSVLHRTTQSDQAWKSSTYQAILQRDGFSGEIIVTAGSPKAIAGFIGCSENISR